MAKVFISYSHRDEKALDSLHKHLIMLRRDGLIETWYDREILAGGDIDGEVQVNLADSDLFLAIVSPDFLASDYCYKREMEVAIKRHNEGTLRVVPIILEPCDWQSSPLKHQKAVPKNGQPISLWPNENSAYLDVAKELRRLVQHTASPSRAAAENTATSPAPASKTRSGKYRIKREFDAIDRDEFREKAFSTLRDFFRRSVEDLNQLGGSVRARFEDMGDSSFSCTVLNKAIQRGEAHITIHGNPSSFGRDIIFSRNARAPDNTANGFIRIEANEYELVLRIDHFSGHQDKKNISAEETAKVLWDDFISRAGIDYV
jgi:hypothetical protein